MLTALLGKGTLVQTDEVDSQGPKVLQRIHQLPQATSKSIIAIDHYRIDVAFMTGSEQPIQRRAMLLGTADASIDVLLDNLPSPVCAVLANFLQLHLWILPTMSTYPGVDRCAFHL